MMDNQDGKLGRRNPMMHQVLILYSLLQRGTVKISAVTALSLSTWSFFDAAVAGLAEWVCHTSSALCNA